MSLARILVVGLNAALIPKPSAVDLLPVAWDVFREIGHSQFIADAGRGKSGVAAARRAKKRQKANRKSRSR